MTRKIKGGEIKKVRLELLAAQGGRCAICGYGVEEAEAVLDHCHKKGHVRAVLHRGCNSLLGKNENNAPRYGIKREQLVAFLHGAGNYLNLHEENVSGLIHPSHFTPEEKVERRKAKAKKQRAKAKKLKLQQQDDTKTTQALQGLDRDQHSPTS